MKHESVSSKFTNSQINLSEAWEYFYKKFQAHRAQKDISEALEQFYSSKSLSEAYRAIITNDSIILALPNRCVQQGYKWQKQAKQAKTQMIQATPIKTHDMWRIKI